VTIRSLVTVVVVAAASPALAGKIELSGGLSANGLRLLDGDGLRRPAFGPGISVTAIEPSELGVALGVDVSASFAAADDALVSDFGASFIWSWLFRDRPFAPFLSLGLSATAISVDEASAQKEAIGAIATSRGLAFGVHGNAGLHGFAGESWYWRVQVGYLAAGVQGFRSQVCLGYVFSSL
jgi:hypothetical protein